MKYLKNFESIRWYSKGSLSKPEYEEIKIGDRVKLKSTEKSFYNFNNKKCVDTTLPVGFYLYRVLDIEKLNGVLCAKVSYNDNWYKLSNLEIEEDRYRYTNESIRWYSKGKLTLDKEYFKESDESFKRGDKVKLINRIRCFYSEGEFVDSKRSSNNLIMEIEYPDIVILKGVKCIRCFKSGYYKIDCIEKIF